MTGTMEHPRLLDYTPERYVARATLDAEKLMELRACLDREPVWATVVDIRAIRAILDGGA